MTTKRSALEVYTACAEITWRLVQAWQGEKPRFAFPPRGVPFFAELRDCGKKLARNEAAQRLVALLIEHAMKETGEAPTANMLLVALEMAGIAVEHVPISEFVPGMGQA